MSRPADGPGAAGSAPHVQLLGLCRFSVPSLGAFQTGPEDIESRRALLYAPERLAHRLTWLAHAALPSLRAQTDDDFRLVLLLGEDFPDPWLDRIQALVADLPQVVIAHAPPGPHREICAAALRPQIDPAAQVVAQFRLDDDDAVAVDFVARVRADAASQFSLFQNSGLMALDYCRGVLLQERRGRLHPMLRRASLWTPGLAVLTRPDTDKMILDFLHNQLWRHMPVLSLPDKVMFLRGAHHDNDSLIALDGSPDLPSTVDWPRLLARRFGIDLAAFAQAIGRLKVT